MYICTGYNTFGIGDTVAEAYEGFQENGGDEAVEDTTFNILGEEVEVELQVKQIKTPTIVTSNKRK